MTIYRPLYRKGELSQVLLTIGIVFVATAAITEMFGAFPYPMVFPDYLARPVNIGFRTYPAYRLFLIAVGAVIAAVHVVSASTIRSTARSCAPRSTTPTWRAASA